ncbi:MAG TPA: DUF721 domain-containing protein [Acidimicrobiales bacterium]|nr:DUF721 domain-containing protein [Acidimicrobiales bacterium]
MAPKPPRSGGMRPLPEEGGPPPRRLGEAIDAYLSASPLEGARLIAALTQQWVTIAGEEVATHCRPSAVRDGVLTLQVDHPAWSTKLAFLEKPLVEGLRKAFPDCGVRALKVHVRGGFAVD